MNIMISRWVPLTLCMFLTFTPCLAGAQSKPIYSVADIQQQTPSAWQGHYEACGRIINVDCPIDIPDVSDFPVLKVRWSTETLFADSFQDVEVEQDVSQGGSGFSLAKNSPLDYPQEYFQNVTWWSEPWNLTKAYAYHNSFTLNEAIQTIRQCYDEYTQGTVTATVDSVYTVQLMKLDDQTAEFIEDTTIDIGYYQIEWFQTLHEIPILGGISMFNEYSEGFGYPMLSSYIASNAAYRIDAPYIVETDIVQDDVPLCVFSDVQQKVEILIESGNVRQVESVRLGYVLYVDRADKSTAVAYPVWVVRCEYFDNAKKEELEPSGIDRNAGPHAQSGYTQLLVNAQTGELLEPYTSDKNGIYCPEIIGWN